MRFFAIFLFVFISAISLKAQNSWKEVKSINELCKTYPDVVKAMFSEYNLNYPGFEKVKAANSRGDLEGACKHLLEYYKNKSETAIQPVKSNKTDTIADTILNNIFVIQNVRGQLPYLKNGHRDWYYKGPKNDKEWARLSNRHSQLGQVYSTYLATGNPKYAEYVDLFLRDFILASMPYPAVKGIGSIWRGLEVAARAKQWTGIFYNSLSNEYISPVTQLLILSSLPDHAHYNRNFHQKGNWLTMELSALATIATKFPEFKKSEEWLNYSIGIIQKSLKEQVYPDGVQTELTSHYHSVALNNFNSFGNICKGVNREMPDFYNRTLEKMYAYMVCIMRPDGAGVLNNDGDRDDIRSTVLNAAKNYDNKEWEYIATNGISGIKPSQTSYFFPWAGQLISRSGFDFDAQWSFFDIGPWGTGHQHNDKLHISVSAYGRDFLVDGGRFAYTGEVSDKYRKYARGSESHNVLLINGKGQMPGSKRAENPLSGTKFKIDNDFDFACGSFNCFEQNEDVEHSRSLFYVRGEFWVIVDRILTDKPRKIDALWHWHPECNVEKRKTISKTKNQKGNLAIIPVSNQKFDLNIVKGQEKPNIQGWYSPEYNTFEPNSTSIYSTEIKDNSTFVWLLFPSEKEMPKIKTKIIFENKEIVKIEVKLNSNCFQLDIPYFDSKRAAIIKNKHVN